MRVIISAGGTGGHIYPALSIINKIKQREELIKIINKIELFYKNNKEVRLSRWMHLPD